MIRSNEPDVSDVTVCTSWRISGGSADTLFILPMDGDLATGLDEPDSLIFPIRSFWDR